MGKIDRLVRAELIYHINKHEGVYIYSVFGVRTYLYTPIVRI